MHAAHCPIAATLQAAAYTTTTRQPQGFTTPRTIKPNRTAAPIGLERAITRHLLGQLGKHTLNRSDDPACPREEALELLHRRIPPRIGRAPDAFRGCTLWAPRVKIFFDFPWPILPRRITRSSKKGRDLRSQYASALNIAYRGMAAPSKKGLLRKLHSTRTRAKRARARDVH